MQSAVHLVLESLYFSRRQTDAVIVVVPVAVAFLVLVLVLFLVLVLSLVLFPVLVLVLVLVLVSCSCFVLLFWFVFLLFLFIVLVSCCVLHHCHRQVENDRSLKRSKIPVFHTNKLLQLRSHSLLITEISSLSFDLSSRSNPKANIQERAATCPLSTDIY
jgi:hypothetical protein